MILQLMIINKTNYAIIGGIRSGGLKSSGLKSGGLMSSGLKFGGLTSGGLKSAHASHPLTQPRPSLGLPGKFVTTWLLLKSSSQLRMMFTQLLASCLLTAHTN